MRISQEQQQCDLDNNNTVPPTGVHCPGTYDTWLCWPPTPANTTVYKRCPGFVPGFSTQLSAHKLCTEDGTWWRHPATNKTWSNYTTCIPPEDDLSQIIIVYEVGYTISLIALLLSLAILLYLRNLRCARITVHMNLFTSFAINNALWLWWYSGVVRSPRVLAANPMWCRALAAVLQYAMLTTYVWMLCEGLYLHTVLVSAFTAERRLLRTLQVAGWTLPLLPAAVHATRRTLAADELCWADEGPPPLEIAIPAVGAVLLNVLFLCNIVRVLCTKMRSGPGGIRAGPPNAALHAFRATCLLAPLLGVQYLLTPFRPARGGGWWWCHELVSALSAGLQGACVAGLYCFANGEVLGQLRRRWRVISATLRPRANSATATTVSFVRSSAPLPEEV